MSREVTTRARVWVKLEVDLSQPWGGECTLDQVFEQAKRSAIEEVELKMRKAGVRVVETQIQAILAEEKR